MLYVVIVQIAETVIIGNIFVAIFSRYAPQPRSYGYRDRCFRLFGTESFCIYQIINTRAHPHTHIHTLQWDGGRKTGERIKGI